MIAKQEQDYKPLKLESFCERIGFSPEIIERLVNFSIDEAEYEACRRIFYQDKQQFFQHILKQKNFRFLFLYYYCRMAVALHQKYQLRGIAESIYYDTFSDLRLWAEHCYLLYGEYGIDEYQWLARHVEFALFKLGSLQYEYMDKRAFPKILWSELEREKQLIAIHIPWGAKLEKPLVVDSLCQAKEFFGEDKEFVCYSWLLSPILQEILEQDSSIIAFQDFFAILNFVAEDKMAEKFIFLKVEKDIANYPEETTLQRKLKAYLLQEKSLGAALGKVDFQRLNVQGDCCSAKG